MATEHGQTLGPPLPPSLNRPLCLVGGIPLPLKQCLNFPNFTGAHKSGPGGRRVSTEGKVLALHLDSIPGILYDPLKPVRNDP